MKAVLKIQRTSQAEAKMLLQIQQDAFQDDLEKYNDIETNPANEPIERLLFKIENYLHYTIWLEGKVIGGIDIRNLRNERYRLNRIFLANDQQNKGLGSRIMKLIELKFPNAVEWGLDTPHLNKRNHYFYEKLGYKKVGEHVISEKLTLIDYVKTIK